MNIGKMDRYVTIEQKSVTRNEVGEEVESWAEFAAVWAAKMPLRGTERYEAQQLNAELEEKWRIRYREGVVPTMRIAYDSRHYDIQSVLELGRREGMELVTTVGDNG